MVDKEKESKPVLHCEDPFRRAYCRYYEALVESVNSYNEAFRDLCQRFPAEYYGGHLKGECMKDRHALRRTQLDLLEKLEIERAEAYKGYLNAIRQCWAEVNEKNFDPFSLARSAQTQLLGVALATGVPLPYPCPHAMSQQGE